MALYKWAKSYPKHLTTLYLDPVDKFTLDDLRQYLPCTKSGLLFSQQDKIDFVLKHSEETPFKIWLEDLEFMSKKLEGLKSQTINKIELFSFFYVEWSAVLPGLKDYKHFDRLKDIINVCKKKCTVSVEQTEAPLVWIGKHIRNDPTTTLEWFLTTFPQSFGIYVVSNGYKAHENATGTWMDRLFIIDISLVNPDSYKKDVKKKLNEAFIQFKKLKDEDKCSFIAHSGSLDDIPYVELIQKRKDHYSFDMLAVVFNIRNMLLPST